MEEVLVGVPFTPNTGCAVEQTMLGDKLGTPTNTSTIMATSS